MIFRILKSAVRAITNRANAPGRQAGGDFSRELADDEMSQIAGADPPDAPYYGTAGTWSQVATREQGKRLVSALIRRRGRFSH